LRLEVFVRLASVVAVDVRLGHQRESDTVVKLAEGGDTGIILRFLTGKLRSRYYRTNPAHGSEKYLIAWEAKDNEALVLWN
jgi:hypothetical protein